MSSPARHLPLSMSQRDIWLDQRSFPESPHLNVGGYGEIHGCVNLEFMAEAIRRIAAESETLRLIPTSASEQKLIAEPVVDIVELDFSNDANPDQSVREFSQTAYSEPFSLEGRRPPWRVVLLKVGERKVGMMTQFHHIVMDGWGSWLFYVRWGEHYTALCEGRAPRPTPDRDYSEAIEESARYRDSQVFAVHAAFWKQKLMSVPEPLFEGRRGSGDNGILSQAILYTHRIPREFYDRLTAFSQGMGVIPYQVFLAVLGLYFARLENREELVIGVPCLNRGGKRYKNTLGMFASVLPLRIRIAAGLTSRELISAIASELRDVYRRQRFPLSEIGRSLKMLEQGRDRLFDVVFSFEKNDFQIGWGEMTGCEARQIFSGVARYPLVATVCEFEPDQDVELVFEASSSVFTPAEVELMGHRILHLVEELIADPDRSVESFDLVPEAESLFLLGDRERTPSEVGELPSFVELFARQVVVRPDAVALVWSGGSLDYDEVDHLSLRLSQFLMTSGVGKGRTVAIVMDRVPEVVVSLLAVARTGAAFLLLDPDAPLARTKRMLEAIDPPVLLLQKVREERLGVLHSNCHVVDIQSDEPVVPLQTEREKRAVYAAVPCAEDLAYVVFTSGSSGEPKGVKVSHGGLSHRLDWLARNWNITTKDRSGQVTQLTFDPCHIELLLPLTQGASVALPPPGRRSAEELAKFFVAFEVSFCVFVPTTLRTFLDAAERLGNVSMRLACCGGDALPAELCRRFSNLIGGALYNLYGPTEASIFVTSWEWVDVQSGDAVPLGRALEGVNVQVLDDEGRLLPIGGVGEIHIGGVGLTLGYLGRPDLDEEAFVADPFQSGARMYRSGDMGYVGVDGNIYILGRRDRQIKLRGYRIELGEIESVMQTHPQVDMAAVKLLGESSSASLHAWIVPKSQESVSVENVLSHMRRLVSDYMVPSSITVLDRLPAMSNGKINYAALSPPERVIAVPTLSGRPLSELERQVAVLWEELLNTGPVGLRDDFFQLGGDSLTAINLLDRLESLTGHRYPLTLISEQPCLQDQVAVISQRLGAESVCVELSSGSTALPLLYLAASGNGDLLRFRNLAKALAGFCSVRMLQPTCKSLGSIGDLGKLSAVYAEVISERAKAMDAGSLWIAGFSVGGVAALETVRLLESQGTKSEGLILLDSVYPRQLLCGHLGWKLVAWVVRSLGLQSLFVNGRHLEAMFNDPGLNWQVGALRRYRPKRCDAPVTLIVTSGLARWKRWFFQPWTRLFRKTLTIRQVPGLHGSIFEAENVTGVAEAVRLAMEASLCSRSERLDGKKKTVESNGSEE
jgi:amino acid adenylation domain-containing protein